MNSNKPISQKQVGGTYGERRQLSSNSMASEPQIQRSKDFFSAKTADTDRAFSSNAQYIRGKNVLPHKKIETGNAHNRSHITDSERFAFLDQVIAGPAENRSPVAPIIPKNQVKSTGKLIKA